MISYQYESFDETLILKIYSNEAQIATLDLAGIGGNSVFIRNFELRYGANTFRIPLKSFPNGIYISRLRMEGTVKVGKLMKF